ncbi:MAG TPA: hypothetical protein DEA08_33740 [Planctomycetes bacterium]|nr:hypothetical protein [Planctomycetota bacterium]
MSDRSRLTESHAVMGSPAYMSPEQLRTEDLDTKSDIYSLGATLYTLLTGEPPFLADGLVELSVRVLQDEPEPPSRRRPDVRAGVEAACMRCLAKDPAQRPSALELADALEGAAEDSLMGKISRRFRRKHV